MYLFKVFSTHFSARDLLDFLNRLIFCEVLEYIILVNISFIFTSPFVVLFFPILKNFLDQITKLVNESVFFNKDQRRASVKLL